MVVSVLCLYGTTSLHVPFIIRLLLRLLLVVVLLWVVERQTGVRSSTRTHAPDVIYHIVPLMKPVFVSGKPYYAEYILMEYIMFQ